MCRLAIAVDPATLIWATSSYCSRTCRSAETCLARAGLGLEALVVTACLLFSRGGSTPRLSFITSRLSKSVHGTSFSRPCSSTRGNATRARTARPGLRIHIGTLTHLSLTEAGHTAPPGEDMEGVQPSKGRQQEGAKN